MRLNTLMTITAVVAFLFGLGFIVVPGVVLGAYGNTADTLSLFLGRYLGASLLGLAFLAWLLRNEATKPVQTGFFVAMVLGFVVSLYDAFAGTHNSLVWLNVVLYLLLGLGFGYFAFMK